MDFITCLPKSEGCGSIMVVVDRFSKYATFVASPADCTAEEAALLFFKNVVKYWGLPKVIVSNRDPRFTGKFWTELFKLLGSELHFSTSFHPQTDGQTEWVNALLECYLRHFVSANQTDWVRLLDVAPFSYNLMRSEAMNQSPFEIAIGQQSLTPLTLAGDYKGRSPLAAQVARSWNEQADVARSYLDKAGRKMKKWADKRRRPKEYNLGDMVMLKLLQQHFKSFRKVHKGLIRKYERPFPIVAKVGKVSYRLELPPKLKIHPVFHKLNLANNNFILSRISHNIAAFSSLTHLNLSHAELKGEIPQEISHLSKLISLDLSHNYEKISLRSHTFSLLLQNLTQISELLLSQVHVSTVLPINLSSSLTYLGLSLTGLHGKLPDGILHLPKLQKLERTGNDDITGKFPKLNWNSNNNSLEVLSVSQTSFSGELPDLVSHLKSLSYLDLSGCKFSGPIPESLGNLTHVTTLLLYSNNFSGHVPLTLANLELLTSFDISQNRFEGQIPDWFGILKKLRNLSLRDNSFSGQFHPRLPT
ncbi:hypothetical protein RJ639_046899 [Escallonia herrerae]|uniref:Integrase catalytic domain-containing protein n=1 Tax=Escallonia herrerae TaxID=1293975 RepID=A0AA88W897_9ASTE|nr:hypothetical protein RJ639_046899 [Escallonia herrerae]